MSMTKPKATPRTFILSTGSRVFWLDDLPHCKVHTLKMETDKFCPKELYLQDAEGDKTYFDTDGCPIYSNEGTDYTPSNSPTIFPATKETKNGFAQIFPNATFANPNMAMNKLTDHLLNRDGKVYCYVTNDSEQMDSGLVHIPDNARLITGKRGLEGFVDSTGALWEYAQPAEFLSGAGASSIAQYDGWKHAVTYKPHGSTLGDTSKVVQVRCRYSSASEEEVNYAGNKSLPPEDVRQGFAVYDHDAKLWLTIDGKDSSKGEVVVTHFRYLPEVPSTSDLEFWT